MIQWKHLQLSSEDYENYINNEDEKQVQLNDMNMSQWQQLYHSVQVKALDNKKIKNKILSYENSIINITSEMDIQVDHQESYHQYCKLNNQLKVRLSELFNQIDLLNLRNISTTIELVISRLLNIQQGLITHLSKAKNKYFSLRKQFEELQTKQHTMICRQCSQHIQNKQNKYLKNEILALEQPQIQVQIKYDNLRRYLREEMAIQEQQYEVKTIQYLFDVEEALRNKQRTMKCTTTPLQTILSDYLHTILQILESKKVTIQPQQFQYIHEYDRVNKSFNTLEEMKKLFKHQQFIVHISHLLEEPFQNFINKINKLICYGNHLHSRFLKQTEVQTTYLKQVEVVKQFQRQFQSLKNEVSILKASKNKLENDLIQNMAIIHKHEIKSMELNKRNKQLQSELVKMEADLLLNRQKLQKLHLNEKNEKKQIIQNNIIQRSMFIRQIKNLQHQLIKINNEKKKKNANQEYVMVNIEVQTDFKDKNILDQQIKLDGQQTKKKLKAARINKRISIQIEKTKKPKPNIHLSQIQSENESSNNLLTKKKNQDQKSKFLKNNNSKHAKLSPTVLSKHSMSPSTQKKWEDAQSVKMIRASPLKEQNTIKDIRQSGFNTIQIASNIIIREQTVLRKINKKGTDIKRQHAYHCSDVHNLIIDTDSPIISDQQISKKSRNISKKSLTDNKRKYQVDLSPILITEQKIHYPNTSCKTIEEEQKQINNLTSEMNVIDQLLINKKSQNMYEHTIESKNKDISKDVMKIKNKQLNNQKIQNKDPENFRRSRKQLKKQQRQQIVPWQQIKIIGIQNQLFINKQEIKKYEKKEGYWGKVDQFIMIDNYYKQLSEKIYINLKYLEQANPVSYRQISMFLNHPSVILNKNGYDYRNHQQYQSCRDKENVLDPENLRQILMKLLKVHQLVHKQCNHVLTFMKLIGFKL